MPALGPRLVVAAPTSGAGKTTFTTGLLAALAAAGHRVAAAKVGPDYIDPGYHRLATGRPGRNLDAWISGPSAVAPLAAQAASDADVLVVEGVMGLFDGASWVPAALAGEAAAAGTAPSDDRLGFASTAHVAELLDAPVLLVVDASATAGSVAPLVHGFAAWAPGVRLGGIVLNRVGSDTHEAMIREALAPTDIPVLGALRRDPDIAWPDRHLGLVPVAEREAAARATIDRLAAGVAAGCDLAGIVALARSATSRPVDPLPGAQPSGCARIAVADGPVFSFTYADNLERLTEAGAELVGFDPLVDAALPDAIDGVVLGGGFPEVHAAALAHNRPLLADARARIAAGLPTWAECGGLLWLAGTLDGHAMVGAVPTAATMGRRVRLGYREAQATIENPVLDPAVVHRARVFHYSRTEPAGEAVRLAGRDGDELEGFATPTLLASYLHLHLGADPGPATRFVAAAAAHRLRRSG